MFQVILIVIGTACLVIQVSCVTFAGVGSLIRVGFTGLAITRESLFHPVDWWCQLLVGLVNADVFGWKVWWGEPVT